MTVSYTANRRDPQDGGPTQYLSWTVFENVSTETVRDFYMDNDFGCEWDKTITQHEQLEIDPTTGVESGRTIKKFPLFSKRMRPQLACLGRKGQVVLLTYLEQACEHESVQDVYSSGLRIREGQFST
ncbi:hypothetical protein R1sor_013301 [Riccia sorocarpa]|uniref:START domain-containing protein n=1 Tax=Riccia sorocarpa TaxID=122646 RepID=A0ABD3H8T9_9MARC